jgi:hypothetical protein
MRGGGRSYEAMEVSVEDEAVAVESAEEVAVGEVQLVELTTMGLGAGSLVVAGDEASVVPLDVVGLGLGAGGEEPDAVLEGSPEEGAQPDVQVVWSVAGVAAGAGTARKASDSSAVLAGWRTRS